jgi:hypothetical protein
MFSRLIVFAFFRYPQSATEPSTITICFSLRHSLKFPQVDSPGLRCHLSNPLFMGSSPGDLGGQLALQFGLAHRSISEGR